ncbi:MAG: hypothetical protein SFV32_11945 [Opitutaceae bacterium]|nr:hypothetical protein [Opitutaceae bacterium]
MKLLSTLLLTVATAVSAVANTITVTPYRSGISDSAKLKNLDHYQAVSWGFDLTGLELGKGWAITGAKLTIKQIYNWDKNYNQLYIDLIDNPTWGDATKKGLNFFSDKNDGWSDYFLENNKANLKKGQDTYRLTVYEDKDGPKTKENFVYNFDADDLLKFNAFVKTVGGYDQKKVWDNTLKKNVWVDDLSKPRQTVGLTFDADCHFYNNGVCFDITTTYVPDTAATLGLFGAAVVGLALLRRRSAR